ncbi:hypothetical protein GCM10020258_14080 [Sphingomonas yabuuchiae]
MTQGARGDVKAACSARARGAAQFLREARDGDDAAARAFTDLIGGEPLHPARQPGDAAVFQSHGGVDELDGAQVHGMVPKILPGTGRGTAAKRWWRACR